MFHQILLCVVTLIIMARWCSARSGMQVKIRGSHKPSRVKKINSIWRNCSSKTHREKMRRGYCDERAPPTYRKTVQLHLSKLGFFLTVVGNGTIHGVNYTYCQQNDRCKYRKFSIKPPPQGGWFFPSTFEVGGGLFNLAKRISCSKNTVVWDRVDLRVVQLKSLSKVFNSLVGA